MFQPCLAHSETQSLIGFGLKIVQISKMAKSVFAEIPTYVDIKQHYPRYFKHLALEEALQDYVRED
jgi:hypothetical protein